MNQPYDKKVIETFNEIQKEILKLGWNGILNKYHPDVNCDDPDAAKTFKLYRTIYNNMQQRLVIR